MTKLTILAFFWLVISQIKANRLLVPPSPPMGVLPPTELPKIVKIQYVELPSEAVCRKQSKCYNIMTQKCDLIAPCAPREYCPTDENSPFYKKCEAYPRARCQVSFCGGCYEYFLNEDAGILIEDCDVNICSLVPDAGSCKAAATRYYYDETYNECKEFRYGGCRGNANNFYSQNDCNAACKIYFKIW